MLVQQTRLHESDLQMGAVLRGLSSMVRLTLGLGLWLGLGSSMVTSHRSIVSLCLAYLHLRVARSTFTSDTTEFVFFFVWFQGRKRIVLVLT
jgi:hypothetical protein